MESTRPETQVFIGSHVRRVAHSGSPTIQRLLNHYTNSGLRFVPKPLSCSDSFEELTYVPGECFAPNQKRSSIAWSDKTLYALGKSLRTLHDNSRNFLTRENRDRWFPYPEDCPDPEVICHGDLGPWNVPVSDLGVGFIDWEMAAPGMRIWDIAYVAWNWVPFYSEEDRSNFGVPQEWSWRDRLSLLLNAYGWESWSAFDVLNAVLFRQDRVIDLVKIAHEKNAMLLQNWKKVEVSTIESDKQYVTSLLRL